MGFYYSKFANLPFDFELPLQRVFESTFSGRRSIVKERFSKKYRHPSLDSKLTLKRLNAVSLFGLLPTCLLIKFYVYL